MVPFQVLIGPKERDGMRQFNAIFILGCLIKDITIILRSQLNLPPFQKEFANQHGSYGEGVS